MSESYSRSCEDAPYSHLAGEAPVDRRSRPTPVFDSIRCKQCGLCAYVCPVGVLELPARSTPELSEPEACTGCRACEFICPDFAVMMAKHLSPVGNPPPAGGGSPFPTAMAEI